MLVNGVIAITDFENRVRSLLGVTSESIENETIGYYEYRGISELTIKNAVTDWESFYTNENTEKQNIFESCIVIKTAMSVATAIQGGLIKLMQTTAAKVEYTGIGLDMRIVALNDKLSETISLLLDNSSEFRGITAFSVTNSDKLRDSRSTDL